MKPSNRLLLARAHPQTRSDMAAASAPTGNARWSAERARRLALVRYTLERAQEQAELGEPLHALALLLMHDAAELFLVLAAEASNAAKGGPEFLAYWDVLDAALAPDKLGHKAEMAAINRARMGLKHGGVIPSKAEIQRLATMTRSFLEDATLVVFAVTLDQATLVDFVPSAAVRTTLHDAEAAIAAGDVAGALGKARIGKPGPLFRAHDRAATKLTRDRLTARAVGQLITRLAVSAAIIGKAASPHCFRHSYAVRALLHGGNVVSVSKLLGHASITTTQRYVDHLATAELLATVPPLPWTMVDE
jgi:hypothetical protein